MRACFVGLAAFVLTAGAALAEPAAPPPAESYGRLPAIADAAISPDGGKIVVARSDPNGAQGFEVLNAADGARIYGARVPEAGREVEAQTLRGVAWADDEHALFTISLTLAASRVLPANVMAPGWNRFDYWRSGLVDLNRRRAYLIDVSSGQDAWGLMNLADVVAPVEGDPGHARVIALTGPYVGDALAVYRVSLDRGQGALIMRGVGDTLDFVLDRRGQPVVRIDAEKRSNRWRALDVTQSPPRVIAEAVSETGAPLDVSGLLPDGRLAGVDLIDGRGRQVLFALDRATGAVRTVFENQRYDITAPILDPWTHEIVGAWLRDEAPDQHFLAQDLADALARLKAAAPNCIVEIENWSSDHTKFVVFIEQQSDAGGYYLFEPASNRLRLIGMRYPDLTGAALGGQQAITYPARDGVRIPAILTLPLGSERSNLPLVVLVHGGPTGRDELGFDWWASFLASRGYAVVQPNFRGSFGFGDEWQRAGYREWGRLMQTDVEDSVIALAHAGIADPARVCVVGASYGGYAALAGAALTPDRYKCAASIAGVSDLPMMLANVELRTGGRRSIASDWWRMLIGDRREDRAHLEEVSPAYQAANVRAPVLLIHGANDTVVPIAQSRRMEERLRAAGKEVRLVEMPGEDHWLSDAPTRIQMLRELEGFLAANLHPGQ